MMTNNLRAANAPLNHEKSTLEVQIKPLSELIAEIKTAAENATCGKWSLVFHDDGFNTDDGLILRDVAGFLPIAKIEGASPDSGFDESFQKEQLANAEFIEAAQPENVLELIAALEQAQLRHSELMDAYKAEQKAYENMVNYYENSLCLLLPDCRYMDPPDGGSVTPLEQVSRMVADYKQQIAELEARPLCVKLPAAVDSCNLPFAGNGWNAYREEAIKAIRLAGGTVEGSE